MAATVLSACHSGNRDPDGGDDGLSMKITAPNQYPAGIPVTAYLTMTNTSNVNANNLFYSIPEPSDATGSGNTTGTSITVINGNNNPCLNIAAGKSCTFPALITNSPVSHPGSFTVTATPNGFKSSNSVKSAIGLQAGNSLKLTANIGLTTVPPNSNSGANGITFLYNPIISANSATESTIVSIAAVVNSATAGAFNTINLTTCGSGAQTLLNARSVSGNSGSGLSNLGVGSVVTFNLLVPAGVTNYQFCAQTQENGTTVDQGNTINPISVASPNSGALSIQPTNFSLYESGYDSQIITLTNIGNGAISQLDLIAPTSPLNKLSTTCGTTLAAGASCQYVVNLVNPPIGFSSQGVFTANYYNGSSVQSNTAQIQWYGLDVTAGISVTSGTNPDFNFTTNTESNAYSSQVTLKNTGNVNESNFTFTLPTYFTLTTGTTATPCTITGTATTYNVTNTLASQAACTLTLTYTNSTPTNGNKTADMTVDYTASIAGIDTKSPTSTIGLSYQTTQATAVLQVTTTPPSLSYVFPSILGNGVESRTNTFSVTNTGNGTAYNVAFSGLQGLSGLVIIPSATPAQDCGTITQIAPNATCLIAVKFGPVTAPTEPITLNKSIALDYKAYNGAGTPTAMTSYPVSGTANAALAANIAISSITFANSIGDGESANTKFAIESSLAPTLVTLVYTNKGLGAANNFTVNTNALAQGYSVANNGCNGVFLESATGTCTLTLNLSRTAPGNPNLNVYDWLLTSYTDNYGQYSGVAGSLWKPNLNDSFTLAYVTIYAPAVVTASLCSDAAGNCVINTTAESSTLYAVFKLTGGYNFPSTSYSVDLSNARGGTPHMSVVGSNSCSLAQGTSTCAVELNAGGAAIAQVVGFTGSNPAPTPSSGTIDVTAPPPTLSIAINKSVIYHGMASYPTLTVTMINAPAVDVPITLTFGSGILKYTTGTCNLSASNSSCDITIQDQDASSNGVTTITANGGGATSNTVNDVTVGYLMYVTESTTAGNLGNPSSVQPPPDQDAIIQADQFCKDNAAILGGGTAPANSYAAVIANSARYPGYNWPLQSGSYYVNYTESVIAQATAGGEFPFPVANAISSSNASVWTGLNYFWEISGDNCNGWTDNSSFTGQIGSSNATSDYLIDADENRNCNTTQHIYCTYFVPG